MLDTATNKEIILNIPMLKDKKDDDHAYAVLSYTGGIKKIRLHAMSCSGEELKIKGSEHSGIEVCKFSVSQMKAESIFEKSPGG